MNKSFLQSPKQVQIVNKDSSNINGISHEMLQDYVNMRKKIDKEADSIQSISSMLVLLEQCDVNCSDFDPYALGQVNRMINTNILNIREYLDDFIYIVRARLILESSETK